MLSSSQINTNGPNVGMNMNQNVSTVPPMAVNVDPTMNVQPVNTVQLDMNPNNNMNVNITSPQCI